MAEEGHKVTLNVYDLSQGLARQLSMAFLGKVVEGIWHTGVVVYDNEYYFGGGIQHDPIGMTPYGKPIRVIDLGVTHVPKDVFEMYLEEISPRYTAETYSLLTHKRGKKKTLRKIYISSMASLQGSFPAISVIRSSFSSSSLMGVSFVRLPECNRRSSGDRISRRRMSCRAMVQQAVEGGAPATYAKEMERLSAKESLLLAFKDAGGFEALVTGKTTDMQRIDVNERITGLERLNPTPRPTTSPFLEGLWNFEWFGSGSPGLFAAKVIFERFPSTLARLSKMNLLLKDGYAKVTAHLKLLNSIESKFILSTKVTVEGPLRMKEEYVEGIFESPTIIEETIPEQLKGAYSQARTTAQQLPVPIRDAVASGLRVPLSGTFQRLFMISYLDEEILILRDTAGIPEVLTKLELLSSSSSMAETNPEYES